MPKAYEEAFESLMYMAARTCYISTLAGARKTVLRDDCPGPLSTTRTGAVEKD